MDKNEFLFSAMGSSYDMTDSSEVVKKGFDYIYYGHDNLFPQHTNMLYKNSSTLNSFSIATFNSRGLKPNGPNPPAYATRPSIPIRYSLVGMAA